MKWKREDQIRGFFANNFVPSVSNSDYESVLVRLVGGAVGRDVAAIPSLK